MEEVFSYRIWDIRQGTYLVAPHKRTAEGIIACSGEILPGSEENVPDDAVDAQGYYRPQEGV